MELALTGMGLVEKVAVIVLVGTFVLIVSDPEPVSPFWVSWRLIDLKMPTDCGGS